MDPVDQHAFATIYRSHRQRVFATAKRVLLDPQAAEEVTQDVFLTLWRKPERFDAGRGALESYLVLNARSRALDAWRSRRASERASERFAVATQALEPTVAEDAYAEVERGERHARLRTAFSALPPEQREAVVLAYWRDLSASEIGRHTGVPMGTAKSRVRLGVSRLASTLGSRIE
ncbi:MAG: hypothetical protein NVSMB25_25070 [Thermoleophilaceae bacterium]